METLQGEGEEKFSPSYQSLSQFQQQEGIRGIAPPPPRIEFQSFTG